MSRPTSLSTAIPNAKTSCLFSPTTQPNTLLPTMRDFIPWITPPSILHQNLNAYPSSDITTGSGLALTYTKTVVPFPKEFDPSSSNYLYLLGMKVWPGGTGTNQGLGYEAAGTLTLADMLVGASGLSSTSTSTQTINTVSLPRYTDGIGVGLELLQWGSTSSGNIVTSPGVDITFNYVDETNASNSATLNINGGGSRGFQTSRACGVCLPTQGIKQVVDYTANASLQTSITDFGILLYKPLLKIAMIPSSTTTNHKRKITPIFTGMIQIAAGTGTGASSDSLPCLGLLWRNYSGEWNHNIRIEFNWLITS